MGCGVAGGEPARSARVDGEPEGRADDPALLDALARREDVRSGPVLILGGPGSGKSTLARALASRLSGPEACQCMMLDPGSPAFGVPGAVCLGTWRAREWETEVVEPLCTLDAARFRLPLLLAARVLGEALGPGPVLIDPPGVVRGVGGAELLTGLLGALRPRAVLALGAGSPPLADELRAHGLSPLWLLPSPRARRPGSGARARWRTALWTRWLEGAAPFRIGLEEMALVGTPPPPDVPQAWVGRQVAVLAGGRPVGLGEVARPGEAGLALRLRGEGRGEALLVRDAGRDARGKLVSVNPRPEPPVAWLPSPAPDGAGVGPGQASGPRPAVRVGGLDATLLNGVFGDPVLELRLRHRGRRILFDLGDLSRLPVRSAHRVTDVFVSHAHFDHIGGFPALLRMRMGVEDPCRLYGPPGLLRHVAAFIDGVQWDRIGEGGPLFVVHELDEGCLRRWRLRTGKTPEPMSEVPAGQGVLLREPGFRVRAACLEHGIPVLAFAFEPDREVRVRPDRLRASGLAPGPWLTELKARVTEAGELPAPPGNGEGGDLDTVLLPDGSRRSVEALARELLLVAPGRRLVYATDLADTGRNRERLVALARRAHTFFCEAPFVEADRDRARRTGHLTARACGEIGECAGARRLVPFHFSRRYQGRPGRVYREVREACARTVVPPVPDAGELPGC